MPHPASPKSPKGIMALNIAIIPARAGSKGLKDKNISLLCGKPLICYTIEAALDVPFFDKVVVTTDSPHVKEICKLYKSVEVIDRPERLAGDDVPLVPVLVHALETIELREIKTYTNVFTLQPTSPLRTSDHILNAYSRFLADKAKSLISVEENLHSIWKYDGGEVSPMYYPKVNRQKAHPTYLGNGAIFISKRILIIMGRDRIGGKISLFPMDKVSSIDIHTKDDLELAEWYLKRR